MIIYQKIINFLPPVIQTAIFNNSDIWHDTLTFWPWNWYMSRIKGEHLGSNCSLCMRWTDKRTDEKKQRLLPPSLWSGGIIKTCWNCCQTCKWFNAIVAYRMSMQSAEKSSSRLVDAKTGRPCQRGLIIVTLVLCDFRNYFSTSNSSECHKINASKLVEKIW